MKQYIAIDIGASSGRHMLGWVEDGRIRTEEVYRFENTLTHKNGHLCWDADGLFAHILEGMRAAKRAGHTPASMGVDTWAVDYALLDENGQRLGDTVAYRDERTKGVDEKLERELSFSELYCRTGIQKQPFNTIYQLLALQAEQPQLLTKARRLLMLPDYFHYLLCGVQASEYTNATSTALVNAEGKTWDDELIAKTGLPRGLFGPLHMPGTTLGPLKEDIAREVGFCCDVVLPATHDTASAYLAVPARDENAVYISSGTWSLLGVEVPRPVITPAGQAANFTNEGGYNYRYRLLKNIMGLWMIQSIRREMDPKPSFAQLEEAAKGAAGFSSLVDVNEECFLAPKSMTGAVRAACEASGLPVPETPGELMRCLYNSLANSYCDAILELSAITGKHYSSINIVGGGSKDGYLNELTAKATGLPVYAGPSEGTVIGNLMAQMIAGGEFANLGAARAALSQSFEVKEFLP